MSNKKKRDTMSDSEESGTDQEAHTEKAQEPQQHFNQSQSRPLKEEDLSESDADDPESKSEMEWDNEEESDDNASKPLKDFSQTTSESPQESANCDATFFLEELSSDDEVYTIQFPNHLDLDNLAGHEFDLEEENVLLVGKDKTESYSVETDYDEQVVTCAMSSRQGPKLINLPIKGHVSIIKVIDEVKTVESDERVKVKDYNKEPVPFPTDLKVRHPLLGVDWKEHIARANDILSGKKVKKTPDESERMEALEKLLKELKSQKKSPRKEDKDPDTDLQEKLFKKLKVNDTPEEEKKDELKEKSPRRLRSYKKEEQN